MQTDRIRTAVPMEVNGPPAFCIEPFVEGLCERGPAALMKLGEPDKNVGIVEELPEGLEFALGVAVSLFRENDGGDMRSRSTDGGLKGRHERSKETRVQLDQHAFIGFESKRFRDSSGTFVVIVLGHGALSYLSQMIAASPFPSVFKEGWLREHITWLRDLLLPPGPRVLPV